MRRLSFLLLFPFNTYKKCIGAMIFKDLFNETSQRADGNFTYHLKGQIHFALINCPLSV